MFKQRSFFSWYAHAAIGLALVAGNVQAQSAPAPATTPASPPSMPVIPPSEYSMQKYGWVPSAESERVFQERMASLSAVYRSGKSPGPEWYQPQEPIIGAKPSPLKQVPAAKRTIKHDALEKAEAYARANNSSAFMVWHKGKLQDAHYFGETTENSLLTSFSMHKMIAGIVVGRAIEQGYIKGLDQKVADFVPEYAATGRGEITIRHILHMSGGQTYFDYSNHPDGLVQREYLSPDSERILLEIVKQEVPPGTRYNYGMFDSDMIAIIIERATKMRYADYVSKSLLIPMGGQTGAVFLNRAGGVAKTGCCAFFTADAYLRFAILLAQDGKWNGKRLLPAWWVKETARPSPSNPRWGLHMWLGQPWALRTKITDNPLEPGILATEPYVADDVFLFDGNNNQVIYISPSKQLVVLRTGGRPPRTPEWDNAFLFNTIARGIK